MFSGTIEVTNLLRSGCSGCWCGYLVHVAFANTDKLLHELSGVQNVMQLQ
jgi:hypothetical protein